MRRIAFLFATAVTSVAVLGSLASSAGAGGLQPLPGAADLSRHAGQAFDPAGMQTLFRNAARVFGTSAHVPAQLTVPQRARSVKRQTGGLSSYEVNVLERINAVRRQRGLKPLRASASLSAAATRHSSQMVQRGFFEHESADGTPFWKRVERYYGSKGFRTWSVGENLVWGSPNIGVNEAVREWIKSAPHRENLLSRQWREIGLAAVHSNSAPGEFDGDPVTVITADFGARR